MDCSSQIKTALNNGDIRKQLVKGSPKKELVRELQQTLYELGFQKELKWDKYKADGDYGNATTAAVLAFVKKNNIKNNGTYITKRIANLLISRHKFLPSMYILWSIYSSDMRTRRYISKGTKISKIAIQVLLNELGYGKQMNFSKFGADGVYGNLSKAAMLAFAKDNEVKFDGDLLTRPLVNLLLKKINKFYGKDWSKLAKNNLPRKKSPLVYFEGSRFIGNPCRADVQFVPMLKKINNYADEANVVVYITSSFRANANVTGAIVKPAKQSNHMAGHGIDMNVTYGNNKWANSKVLAKYPNVPAPVKQFLKSIIDDPDLRWGGKFNPKDPVHIDDGLNRDETKWFKRYKAMQEAIQIDG